MVPPVNLFRREGPYPNHYWVVGLVVHMVLVGLLISFRVQRFGRVLSRLIISKL
jgi:hypothetical protein